MTTKVKENKVELATLASGEVIAFFNDNKDLGIEDVKDDSVVMPQLRLTTPGSKKNILLNGKKATVGFLFHTELKEEYETVDVVITTISKCKLPKYDPTAPVGVVGELKMNYLVGGFLVSDSSPFLMYVKGMSINPFWAYLADVSSVRARYNLPLFALKSKISVDTRASKEWGDVEVIIFSLYKDEYGVPLVENDLGKLTFYKDAIDGFKNRFTMIASKGITEEETIQEIDSIDGMSRKEALDAMDVQETSKYIGDYKEEIKDPNSLAGKYEQLLRDKKEGKKEAALKEAENTSDIPF